MLQNEIIEDFLAAKLNITSRAVRMMKKDSPERYEREMIGSLFKTAGMTLEDAIEILNTRPSLFNLDVYKKSLVELADFKRIVCKDGSKNETHKELDFIANFLRTVFYKYTNEENQQFSIYVHYDNMEFENPKINVGLTDVSCVGDEYLKQISFYPENDFTLESICKTIKSTFPTMKNDVVFEYYSFEFDVEMFLHEQDSEVKNSFLKMMKDQKNLREIKSVLFRISDDLTFEYTNGLSLIARNAYGLSFCIERYQDELEKELAYYEHLKAIRGHLKLNEPILDELEKKVEKFFYMKKRNIENDDFFPLNNYEICINEHISKGITGALENIIDKFTYNFPVPLINIKTLKSNFKEVSELHYVCEKKFTSKGRYMDYGYKIGQEL